MGRIMKLTDLLKRALTETIVDIGQLSDTDRHELKSLVKKGILDKGKGGPYPTIKTVYACHGFDFAADREAHYRKFLMWHALDVARRVVQK